MNVSEKSKTVKSLRIFVRKQENSEVESKKVGLQQDKMM